MKGFDLIFSLLGDLYDIYSKNMNNCAGKPSSSDVLSWQDVLNIGEALPDQILQVKIHWF